MKKYPKCHRCPTIIEDLADCTVWGRGNDLYRLCAACMKKFEYMASKPEPYDDWEINNYINLEKFMRNEEI